MKKIIYILALIIAPVVAVGRVNSEVLQQESPKTLFEYPQAPDTITSFQDRANYVIKRFWDNFDVSKPVKDEMAFEVAFCDYLNFFPHADKLVVLRSINDLMYKLQSNKSNFLLIGRLAEKNLYSSQAMFVSDEAYLPFAEAMVKNKSLKKNEREYYRKQIERINQNKIGALCPELDVTCVDGSKTKLSSLLGDKMTLLFFNDGECSDCVLARLRLSTNVLLNKLITDGELKIIYIYPKKYNKEWATEAATWADNWTIVATDDALKKFDVRQFPGIFILNEEKKIADKNVSVDFLLRQ